MNLPKKVGPVTLMRRLTTDGITESYAGILDEPAGKQVVARRVLPYIAKDPTRMARLASRLEDLTAIRHPLLCSVLDHHVADGETFVIEEWREAIPFDELLSWCKAENRTIPHNVYLNLATQLCNALEALHSRPGSGSGSEAVLHLGLSPKSAFIDRRGKVLIGRCGLVASPTTLGASASEALNLPVEYLAPEQTHDDQEVTPATDIFSMGAILYEMLLLKPMFRDDSTLQTIHRIRRAEVITHLLEVKELLAGLDKVLYRALALNPRHRYQRAFVLREDLRGLMAGFSFSHIDDDTVNFLKPLIRQLADSTPDQGELADGEDSRETTAALLSSALESKPKKAAKPETFPNQFGPAPGPTLPPDSTEGFIKAARGLPAEPMGAELTPVVERESSRPTLSPVDPPSQSDPALEDAPEPPPAVPLDQTSWTQKKPAPKPSEEVTAWEKGPVPANVPPLAPAPTMPPPQDDAPTEPAPPGDLLMTLPPPLRVEEPPEPKKRGMLPFVLAGVALVAVALVAVFVCGGVGVGGTALSWFQLRSPESAEVTAVRAPSPVVAVPAPVPGSPQPIAQPGASIPGAPVPGVTSGGGSASADRPAIVVADDRDAPPLRASDYRPSAESAARPPEPRPTAASEPRPAASPDPRPSVAVVVPEPMARPEPVVAPEPLPLPEPDPEDAIAYLAEEDLPEPEPAVTAAGGTDALEPLSLELSGDDLDQLSSAAFRGALSQGERLKLSAVGTSDPDYTRAVVLLYQDSKARADVAAQKQHLDALMSRPENQYRPEFLVEQAQMSINSGDFQTALQKSTLAERHWARLPSDLIFSRKAMIYEIQASAQEGIFYQSDGEDLDALHEAIEAWEKYARHAATKTRPDMTDRANEKMNKLRDMERRLQ